MKITFKLVFQLFAFSLPFLIFFAILQPFSLVVEQTSISTSEVKLASDVIKKVDNAFRSSARSIDFTLTERELAALSKMGSYLIPDSKIYATTSDHSVVLAVSTKVLSRIPRYFNVSCFLSTKGATAELYNCKLGYIPINGRWVKWLGLTILSWVIGNEMTANVNDMINELDHDDKEIRLISDKPIINPQYIKNSLQKIGQIAQILQHHNLVEINSVQAYLEELNKHNYSNLAPHIKNIFSIAKIRSKTADPIAENTAILWALAIQFGDSSFSSMAGVNYHKGYVKLPTLRGRVDLTQHFVYSAILYQLGHESTALAVGETKELLDSLKDGSGFSFSDLAADKAGIVFSDYVTGTRNKALKAQEVLANLNFEDVFFPYIHDLPDGFKEDDYTRIIGNISSKNYRFVEKEIDKRIESLALYSKNDRSAEHKSYWEESVKKNVSFSWYKVDTQVHSHFSRGTNGINTLVAKASEFGCDAIAIADYGRHLLEDGKQKEFVDSLIAVRKASPELTIMAALDWNIPPFKGKEQATVILPHSYNEFNVLEDFAHRFDQNHQYSQDLLSAKFAFEWLNKQTEASDVKSLILYNHPNKRNVQQRENEHDIEYWRELSSSLVSFSGSPGNQKLTNSNGYRKIQTENGWDPSVSQVGGEWDRLLQKGYKIWGASASSEFTSVDKDYWPCEYSSTHVQSESASQNHILAAFQAGRYWGQQGNFVKNLSFSITTDSGRVVMGQMAKVDFDELVNINLSVELNLFDWQSELSDLDELELIVITDERIDAIKLDTVKMMGNTAVISMPFFINSENTVFRFRGSHINLADQTMMFYTNPIKLVSRVH